VPGQPPCNDCKRYLWKKNSTNDAGEICEINFPRKIFNARVLLYTSYFI